MKSNQRDGPIITTGIVASILTAILTVIAVVLVINKLNDNADAAFLAALNAHPVSYAQGPDDPQVPSIKGQNGIGGTSQNENLSGESGQSVPPGNSGNQVPVGGKDEEPSQEDGDSSSGENQDDSDETDLSVETGVSNNETTNDAEEKEGEQVSEGDDSVDDSSALASEDASDSTENADVGSADGKYVVGLEYLSIAEDGTAVYHVVWGDTLADISRKLGFSVEELADYNKIRDVNLIYAGSLLRVPLDEESLELLKQAQSEISDGKAHVSVHTGPEEDEE